MMNKTNTLLTLILLAIVAVGGVMIYQENQDGPMEEMSESVNEFTEEIGDEIDDATIAPNS